MDNRRNGASPGDVVEGARTSRKSEPAKAGRPMDEMTLEGIDSTEALNPI
jgi:hypothetical protein